ncbi:DUF4760 domain-containing protein [Zobellella aerophila]|uniref:DUF4760 domain-containing protein n=1 Tax=Zobellella aerophila TaxID=870480 RepID=A0ABP6VJJ4_9GAMM
MTEYEHYSLALTAIGHLIVALSILYAARSWLVSEQSLKREIQKDTRSYLADIDAQIRSIQRELHVVDINAENLSEDAESRVRVNGLLNIIESVGYELKTDFYDSKAIQKYITPLAAGIWHRWHPYVFENRILLNKIDLWEQVEVIAKSYNK